MQFLRLKSASIQKKFQGSTCYLYKLLFTAYYIITIYKITKFSKKYPTIIYRLPPLHEPYSFWRHFLRGIDVRKDEGEGGLFL